jgi:hypothetical protein
LGELAAERETALTAVRTLRLTPVMFELGARPHPPQDLYRSYLDRSDVFVGIYWQSYGWVAPDMDVSGVEDEYALAGDRPRLIYVKEPAPSRDPRLKHLLDRIRTDDRASYKHFQSPDEVAELLVDDLAVLLSERFAEVAATPSRSDPPSGTLTFLFSDIEGSTELLERLGDEYAGVLGRYLDVVRTAVAGHEGVLVDTEGDGTFSVFTDAAGAADAAVEIQRALARELDDVRARLGLHTGRATTAADGYVGPRRPPRRSDRRVGPWGPNPRVGGDPRSVARRGGRPAVAARRPRAFHAQGFVPGRAALPVERARTRRRLSAAPRPPTRRGPVAGPAHETGGAGTGNGRRCLVLPP